jgi:hypothetical protein
MASATFGLPGRRAALHCVVHLRRRRAASPPSSPLKIDAPLRIPFSISISHNQCHLSSTTAASLPLTTRLLPPYGPIKGATRTPPLSIAPTPAPIYSPRARNHLPIGAPLTASVERRHVTVSAAPPPSGAISENSDILLSLTLSLSLRAITTTSWAPEPVVVPWSIDLIHDFSYKNNSEISQKMLKS